MFDIVIINYFYDKYVPALIKSIEQDLSVSSIPHTITIVDNSNSIKKDVLNDFKCNLISNKDNRGYSAAVNQGSRQGNGRFILILNADTQILTKDGKSQIKAVFDQSSGISVVGCKLVDQYGRVVGAGTTGSYQKRRFRAYGVPDSVDPTELFNQQSDCISVCGAAYFVNRQDFEKLGGFDEDFFMYHEEEYFSFKVQFKLHKRVV